jgi:hypothetical protein
MHVGLHVKYPLFMSDFKETCNFVIVYRKMLNTKFHEYPSRGTDGDRTKLIVASRNFADGPQNTIKVTDTIFQI